MNKMFYDNYRVQSENYGLFGSDALYSTGWMGVLPAKAKDLYLALKSYMNVSCNIAWPSTKRLEIDTLMNGTDIRTSAEFLNLIGLINIIERGSSFTGKSTEYQLRNVYLKHDFRTSLSRYIIWIITGKKDKNILKNASKNNKDVYNQRLNKVKEYISKIKEEDIKLIFKVRGELERGVVITDYKYELRGNIINNSVEYEYLEKLKLMIIKDLMQAVYTALRVSSISEKYNHYNGVLLSDFFKKLEVLLVGDNNTDSETKESVVVENTPIRGSNIQVNRQENRLFNNDDESIHGVGINTPNFEEEDRSSTKDKVLNHSKVKKLLKDIEGQLVKFNVSQEQQDAIMSLLENKNLQHLNDVFESFKLLIEVNFEADDNDNDNYAWSVCNKPSTATAKAAARGFKNRSLRKQAEQRAKEVNKDRAPLKPTPRDYYDQFFD